jgi:hypothetical protein
LNTPQRQALENQINNAATRGEVAQKLTESLACCTAAWYASFCGLSSLINLLPASVCC